jgi:hypothetical protein
MLGLFDGLVVFAGNGSGEAYCFDANARVWTAAWISSPGDHMLLCTPWNLCAPRTETEPETGHVVEDQHSAQFNGRWRWLIGSPVSGDAGSPCAG